jgi:hypothetical protein
MWVLPRELVSNGPALAAFERDLGEVRTLSHPNIARVLDVDHDGDTWFVATELAQAETLRSVLDALGPERLESREADAIVEAVGSALLHAHSRGIVHGDVRPENVLVTNDHDIKLTNFMLASLARNTPFAPALLNDARALASFAYELYCGVSWRPGAARLRGKGVLRHRLEAIETVLRSRGVSPSVGEFLARAGLADAGWRPRAVPRDLREPVGSKLRRTIAVAALAAIGAGLYAGDQFDWRPAVAGLSALAYGNRADSPATSPAGVRDNPAAGDAAPADVAHLATSSNHATPQQLDPVGTTAPHRGSEAHAGVVAARADAQFDGPSAAAPTATLLGTSIAEVPNAAERSAPSVTLSTRSVTVYESQVMAAVDVIRSGDSATPIDIVWWTSDGTARAVDDYASFGPRVETLTAGETVHTLYVPLAADAVGESPEHFYVNFDTWPRDAALDGTVTAEIRIIDDDF